MDYTDRPTAGQQANSAHDSATPPARKRRNITPCLITFRDRARLTRRLRKHDVRGLV